MGLKRITVRAKRKRRFDPERPENRVVLWDRDRRHPGGQAFLAEGDTADVYPTAAVKKKLGTELEEVSSGDNVDRAAIDDDALGSLGLDGPLVATLQKGGIDSVTELLDAYKDNEFEKFPGVGEKRVEVIRVALAEADLIDG